ncbi:MAG: hypothetical protein M1837_004956 [Sclerophora amabilis]|nr:MAG: hypothetical protein M1837_004956 [Sclerophora amabilis]
MTSQKCVHKGCGKTFTDPDEACVYHSGPPVFHEGQKGWKCCKTRVLTFDEFLSIPPCTTGKHSSVDDTPAPEPAPSKPVTSDPAPPAPKPKSVAEAGQPIPAPSRQPQSQPQIEQQPSAPPESDSDDSSIPIPPGATCRRRGCNITYASTGANDREGEKCVHHPGHPIFHEGNKGYTCCKRRVLDFDEFMGIEGCKTKDRHMFVGSGGKRKKEGATSGGEELLETVKHDFYQTSTLVIVSLYLKKILPLNTTDSDNRQTSITFPDPSSISFDLPTSDKKRYRATWPLYASVDTEKSSWTVMGTKVELNLVKAEAGQGWPVLRADEKRTGEIIQVGKAGRA